MEIREILNQKGFTAKELAERMNVSQANVADVINGELTPSPEFIKRIAAALDVEVSELAGAFAK